MSFTVSTQAQKAKGNVLQWKIAAELPALNGEAKSLGFAGPVAGVHNNALIVAGGTNFPGAMPWLGGKKKYYDELYVFIKNKKTITPVAEKFKLTFPVAYAASCSTPAGIVYAGGENENGISNKSFLVQWDAVNKKIITSSLPDVPAAVTNAAAVYHNGIVYLAGGEKKDGVSDKMYSLNINDIAAGWKEFALLPKPISHTVMLAVKNKIYLIGGRKKNGNGISELYNSVYELNLSANQWTEKKSLPYALSAGTGAVYKNQLLVFGGDKGETFHKTEVLIAAIGSSSDEGMKQQLTEEKANLQATHPGFSKEILAYNILTNEWATIGDLSFETPVTTTAVTWNKCFFIPSGEIKAGVRSPYIFWQNQ